jgi:hypothetical protein
MAYTRNASGRFRLRASFDIPPQLVEQLNRLCERTGLSMASLCQFACERLVAQAGNDHAAPAPDRLPGGGQAATTAP